MKKYLLLFAFSALALTSCEDDDIQHYEMDLLKGEWKTVKSEVISGKDDKTVLSTDIYSGCSAKTSREFRTDYYAAYTAYSGIGASCSSVKYEGKYTYDSEAKDLVITLDNDTDRKYKIVILSSTELRIKQMHDNIDQNGDQIIDVTYFTYKR